VEAAVARELFVDTSGWYPVVVRTNAAHPAAAAALRDAVRDGFRLVTTNLVVAETHALLLSRVGREAALAFLKGARQEPTRVIESTPSLEARAQEEWIERFADQDFTLTDAVSFAVMRERRIERALALDRHFAVAGFGLVPG
jgi:predicted nucleic acid-binding protein